MSDDLPRNLTIDQAARYLNVSEKSVRRYLSQGLLRGHRIGPRNIRIDRESLLKLGRPVGGAR